MVHYKVTYNWTWSWGTVEPKEWTLHTETALDNYISTLRRNTDQVSDLVISTVKVK